MVSQSEQSRRSQLDADPIRVLKPITVGVDGSAHNQSAIAWGADEARRSGRPLLVITATGDFIPPTPHFSGDYIDSFDYDAHASKLVARVKASLEADDPSIQIRTRIGTGSPSNVMIGAADDSHMLVVGKRGLGAFTRVMVGSTSIAVVGRSIVPTVVVPDTWDQRAHATESILVGIDAEHDNDAVLSFGFARAHELGVPMVALHVWDIHPALILGDEDRSRWGVEAQAMVESQLAAWRDKFPDVEALASQRNANPALGLLDAAEHAQLLVVGRRSSNLLLGGLPFGSVTRAVLHYSEQPVAVVPTGGVEK
jgi:nucleotide-binding universal stress UspA family protein